MAAEQAQSSSSPTPPAGAGGQPGQPPFGASPATTPNPNAGFKAQGKVRLGLIVRLMEMTLPDIGAGSEEGRDLLKALNTLAKHVPTGSAPQGVESAEMQRLMMKQKENGMQVAQMRQAGQAPQGAPSPEPQPQAA